MSNKAVFLDRDGTINYDVGYTHMISEFRFIEHVVDGLKLLYDCGYKLYVITNQSGVARGLYTLEQVHLLHQWLNHQLLLEGVEVEEFLVCPHHPDFSGACDCRKPGNLLIENTLLKHRLDRELCWMVGDRATDLGAANSSRVRFVGVSGRYVEELSGRTSVVRSVWEAAQFIVQNYARSMEDEG